MAAIRSATRFTTVAPFCERQCPAHIQWSTALGAEQHCERDRACICLANPGLAGFGPSATTMPQTWPLWKAGYLRLNSPESFPPLAKLDRTRPIMATSTWGLNSKRHLENVGGSVGCPEQGSSGSSFYRGRSRVGFGDAGADVEGPGVVCGTTVRKQTKSGTERNFGRGPFFDIGQPNSVQQFPKLTPKWIDIVRNQCDLQRFQGGGGADVDVARARKDEYVPGGRSREWRGVVPGISGQAILGAPRRFLEPQELNRCSPTLPESVGTAMGHNITRSPGSRSRRGVESLSCAGRWPTSIAHLASDRASSSPMRLVHAHGQAVAQ